MKKTLRRGISFLALFAIGYTSQAQQYAATMLDFTNQHPETEHEFGFSTVGFNDYSIYGTQFNKTINVYKGNALLFQAVSPQYLKPNSGSFGHALAMNQNWIAASAFADDLTPNDANTFAHGRVYLSKNINGVPQNSFTTSITAQTTQSDDYFGTSIEMSGQWLAVGAPGLSTTRKGYVEIWKETATSWERKQKIQPANLPIGAQFGFSVAIHGDYMVVGAPGIQTIYVYKNTNNVWALHSSYKPDMTTWKRYPGSGSLFGFDVDIYENKIIVGDGHTEVQKAALLNINASTTTLLMAILPPGYSATQFTHYGWFGYSVAIGEDKALVGAPSQYGPDITDKQLEGKVFFYGYNFQYEGYMNAGAPAGKEIRGLGKSVSIDNEYILVGAENTNNLNTPRLNEGVAFRMPFYYITETGNTPPSVTITSPSVGLKYTAPATITIEAVANDVDGTINKVEFYQNSTYLGSDNTAPYTFTLSNVTAGNKFFYVKAFDNQGATAINDVSFTVNPTLPPANISGPACGSNNQILLFEVSPALRTNATGFNWSFSGAAQSIIPVNSTTTYKANLSTGNYFSGGQLCVGISYNGAPYYQSYCINVQACSSNRESSIEESIIESKLISFPNPFNSSSIIELATPSTVADIQVVDASGKVVLHTQATGSLTFGSEFSAGIYLVKIETSEKTEFIKVVKE